MHFAQVDGEVSDTAIDIGAAMVSPLMSGNDEIRDIWPTSFRQAINRPLNTDGEVPIYVTYLPLQKITAIEDPDKDLAISA